MTKLQLKSVLSKEKQAELDKLKNLQQKKTADLKIVPQDTMANKVVEKVKEKKTDTTPPISLEDIKKAAVQWLIKTWPLLFSDKADKPLKIGIHKDILEVKGDYLPCSKTVLRKALSYYVSNPVYLKNTLTAKGRYDLEGKCVQEIEEKNKEFVGQRLEQIKNNK